MPKFNIKLIDTVFEINCVYDYCFNMSKEYLTNENAIYQIFVTKEDIEYEKNQHIKVDDNYNLKCTPYTDEEYDSFSVFRKIGHYFLDNNGFIIHGAAVAKDNEGYLFIAPSYTGKTTHVRLWVEQFKDTQIINGDTPIIKIIDNKVFIGGAPWAGKDKYNNNITVPLKAICLLNRGLENKIIQINDTDLIFEKIYGHILKKEDKIINIVRTIKTIIENTKCYSLECNTNLDSANVSYNGMK